MILVGKNNTRDVFYVRRKVNLMKTTKVNAYFMHTVRKIELLSMHASKIISKCITLMTS